MARTDLLRNICEMAGSVRVRNEGDGWPGLVVVHYPGGAQGVALHVSNVSTHARADYERRFQNPGNRTPVQAPRGYLPILCGVAEVAGKSIIVVVDGRSRLGREARFSILFNVSVLQSAAARGWAEYTSGTGEVITAMDPRLLPAYVNALKFDVSLEPIGVQEAAGAFDLPDDPDASAGERTRTMVARLVRKASFGRDVCKAYDQKCAMCGIGLKVLEGAHILPVGLPNSTDSVWNGLALCRNHHRLFDRNEIWVDPDSRILRWHPRIIDSLKNETDTNFVENTFGELALPRRRSQCPRPEMFVQRYRSAAGEFDWVE